MLSKSSKTLRRSQLDRALHGAVSLHQLPQPKRGWLREVREALGMSAQQLARRMGVSQPTVAKMEKTEAAGTITLASLHKAADAMGCRLVYAFVPQESLEAFLRARALEVAERWEERVSHTMALEAQEEGRGALKERRVQEMADELVRTLSRDLWEDEPGHSRENLGLSGRARRGASA